jgi:hypothetical protein
MTSKLGLAFGCALLACGWDTPHTDVIIANGYPPSSANVIYQAFWLNDSLTTPITPGSSSEPQASVFASPTTAYVLLAPGWGPGSTTSPESFVVLASQSGFELHSDTTLTITVDDATFAGNCAVGSVLTQAEADFVTQRVFAQTFAGLQYDAATCTTTGGL